MHKPQDQAVVVQAQRKTIRSQSSYAKMDNWRLKFEPVITPLFRTFWRFSRAATLGVRGIACDAEGRVLLVKHTYLRGWHLPGGGVERGETAPYAIAREMEEEGGIEATEPPAIFALYSNHANFAGDHIGLYRISAWKPCPPRPALTTKSPSAASSTPPIRPQEPPKRRCGAWPRCSKARRPARLGSAACRAMARSLCCRAPNEGACYDDEM